ncbi:MAG: ROK family protein [Thermoflexibacter sp.]
MSDITKDIIPVVIGIDIGGTNTKFGFVDKEGNCLGEGAMPTKAEQEIKQFLPRLYQSIDDLLKTISIPVEIRGIGIGVPNGNYYTGTVEDAANINWGKMVPLAYLVQEHYKLPTVLTNDANAAAIGEMLFGVAQGMKDFIIITLGTGLGSGLVANGQLIYGHDGFAGELGHLIVDPNGRFHGNSNQGVLEAYVSATGIKRTAFEMMAKMIEPSPLRDVSFNQLDASMITDAALKGDAIAIACFEYTGRLLGMKLADAVAHLSPEAIVLFGGLTKAGKYLLEPTKKYMESYLFPIYRNKIKLLISGLEGKNAAVLGASALIWSELEKKKEKEISL